MLFVLEGGQELPQLRGHWHFWKMKSEISLTRLNSIKLLRGQDINVSDMKTATCRINVRPLRLPRYKQIEHSQGHEGDTDVKANSHCSILLEDLLQLLGLIEFCSL